MSEPAVTLTHDDLPGLSAPDPGAADASDAPSGPLHVDPQYPSRGPSRGRERGPSRGRERHRARRVRRPTLRWRVLVATVGAIVLTVCSGMALGIVSWTPSGLEFGVGNNAAGPPRVTGADGIYPGGPVRNVSVTVQNVIAGSFEITAVTADLSGAPPACPASAWQVGAPPLMPTVPARSEVTVPLPITLRPDAPDACQGLTARFDVRVDGLRHAAAASIDSGKSPTRDAPGTPDGPSGAAVPTLRPERLDAVATVTAARLGSPAAATAVRGGAVEITPAPPSNGPPPTAYDVEVVTRSDRATAGVRATSVCAAVTGVCVDHSAPAASTRRYIVTSRVGTHWRRPSPEVRAWTPPPAPALQFADREHPQTSALLLSAPSAASAYDVDVIIDGRTVHSLRIAAGTGLTRSLSVPTLGTGTHRMLAVSRFHGWHAPSAALHCTVSETGIGTAGPDEAPSPISSEPRPTSELTAGPPSVSLSPPTTTAAPTRTTSLPSISIKRRVVARPPTPVIAATSETTPPATETPAVEPQNPDAPSPAAEPASLSGPQEPGL